MQPPRRRPAPSIRRVVATTMLVPVLALTVALVVLGAVSARSAAERTGSAALRVAAVRAQAELRSFLNQAHRLSRLVAMEVPSLAPQPPLGEVALRLAELAQAFPATSVAVVAWPDGRAAGAIRDPDGMVVFEVVDGTSTEWRIDEEGAVIEPPVRSYDFDPRERPWYTAALASQSPRWTAPYTFVRRDVPGFELGISYVRQVNVPPRRRALGSGTIHVPGPVVVAVDVTFDALSRFLAETALARSGELLVVDDRFDVLASSAGPVTTGGGLQRLPEAIGDGLKSAAARTPQTGAQEVPDPSRSVGSRVFGVRQGGQDLLVAGESLAVDPGREWFVIAAIPRQILLGEARQVQLWLILLSILALASAVGGLLWLVARVTRPVERLQAHVQRLGAGEAPAPLDLRASRELESLSSDLNRMATALGERLELQRSMAMAREMQQALLPAPTLDRSGLSLLGHIDYCDVAGGDYFDFIEITGREGVLVAVGDVMGHGVDSTILMATARAALRTEARRTESLGAMLLRVSSVLLQGRRHGRFMTMFLLHVEHRTGRIRWANAGHDPGLLVLPGAAEATVLGGGDLPLGIDEGVVYFEQSAELPPGTLLYLGTDGIREAQNADGEIFGDERLQAALVELAPRPLGEVRDGLLERVRGFRHGRPSSDDVTVVLGRVLER